MKDMPNSGNPGALRTFQQLLQAAEDGDLHSDLTDAAADLSMAIRDASFSGGKPKGSITVKLDFIMDRGLIELTGEFKVTKPKKRRGRTILHQMPNGELSLNDPRQPDLPLRDVSNAVAAIRNV